MSFSDLQGNRLYEVMQMWNAGIAQVKHGYLALGEAVSILKKEKLWRLSGSQPVSWNQFCTQELHCSVSQANRLAEIYVTLGDALRNIPIDISKVTLLLPYLVGLPEDQKAVILEQSKDLTVEAIKNNLKDMQGNGCKATDVCAHEGDLEDWRRCRGCGKFFMAGGKGCQIGSQYEVLESEIRRITVCASTKF